MLTPTDINDLRKRHYNAELVHLHKPHPELAILRVKPDFQIADHQPGQYSTLGLGYWEPRSPGCQEENLKPGSESRLVRRAYSISHSILEEQGRGVRADDADMLEFYIVLVRETGAGQGPALTPRLFMLKQGERLCLGEKITGHFTLEPVQPTDTVIFLSTGTGEAPHNYMLWELLRQGHQGNIVAACCVRYWQDLAYLDTHKRIQENYSNYSYIPLTTREKDTLQNKVYIQDLVDSGELEQQMGKKLNPDSTHVFLCGNPKMIGVPVKNKETGCFEYPQPMGVIEVLESKGFQVDRPSEKIKGNIHYEEYW